ncbi:MAG: PEGA domain-containing protein [Planctomycetales bacterium]|nr:PEGA domain-containing protein [Planctomycetales bacterium]
MRRIELDPVSHSQMKLLAAACLGSLFVAMGCEGPFRARVTVYCVPHAEGTMWWRKAILSTTIRPQSGQVTRVSSRELSHSDMREKAGQEVWANSEWFREHAPHTVEFKVTWEYHISYFVTPAMPLLGQVSSEVHKIELEDVSNPTRRLSADERTYGKDHRLVFREPEPSRFDGEATRFLEKAHGSRAPLPKRESPGAPTPDAASSYVKLSSSEPGIEVYLDGSRFASLDVAGPQGALVRTVPPGKHRIEARKEFFQRHSLDVTLEPNGVWKHHFVMERVAGFGETATGTTRAEQARGELTILSARSGVTVVMDGRSIDVPTELTGVPAGEYSLRVVVGGREERVVPVTIRHGQKTIVNLDR